MKMVLNVIKFLRVHKHLIGNLNSIGSILLIILSFSIQSKETPNLSEGEIKSSKKVKFQNKDSTRAPDSKRNLDAEIGAKLSQAVDKNSNEKVSGIFVKRYISPDDKLGGDVLTLSNEFKANHINTIKRILSAYIQSSFSYDTKKSDILTFYVLYYNVMHRNNKNFFSEKYSKILTDDLVQESVGISVNYSEWTGKTQIVVPFIKNILKDKKTDLPLSELEDTVNPDLDKNKKGIQEKGELTDLVKEKTVEERKLIDQKIKQAEKKENEIQKNQKNAEDKLAELKNNPNSSPEEIKKLEELGKEISKEKEKLLEVKKELSEKEKEIANTEKKLESKDLSKTSTEKPISPKQEEGKKIDTSQTTDSNPTKESVSPSPEDPKKQNPKVIVDPTQEAREATANLVQEAKIDTKDVQKELEEKTKLLQEKSKELNDLKQSVEDSNQKSQNTVGNKILFLQVVKYDLESHYTNDLWLLDPDEEEGLYKSPFENICGRDFKVLPTGVLVIGFEGQESDNSIHHLVLLKKEDLSVLKVSKENIFWKSQIFAMDGKIYTFELGNDKKIYLSRFSEDLVFESRSSEPVNINSDITFNKSKIFVTSKLQNSNSTSIMVLNKEDMSVLKNFKPTPKRILVK
jgi:uncharacterized membrane protein